MPRPSGIIAGVSRPDMAVCGLFHVRRALEIEDKFTGAAMHTWRPVRVICVGSAMSATCPLHLRSLRFRARLLAMMIAGLLGLIN